MRNRKVAAVVAMLLVVMTAVVRAQSGSGIQYFYDDLAVLLKSSISPAMLLHILMMPSATC